MNAIPRAALLLALAAGPASAQPAPQGETLRLSGSNTIGAQLAPDLLIAYGKSIGLEAVKIEQMPDPEEHTLLMSAAETARQLQASVAAHGSGTAFPALRDGKADIGMASRRVTDAEVAMLKAAGIGDPTAPGNAYVLSLDGVVVLVHPDNKVKTLTLEQIHRLFSGQVGNWSALGGRDLPVTVYSRDSKSGTYDTFRSLVMGSDKIAASAKLFESSEDLADSVASDPGGIGFVGFAYSRNARPVTVALPCGIAVAPKPFFVRSEEYPLFRRLYLYTPDKKSALVRDFLKFALSDPAQPIVQRAGFINLVPETAESGSSRPEHIVAGSATPGPHQRDAARLAEALAKASRVSTTFRFEFDSFTLDARARDDVGRVAAWLGAHPGHRLILVGYASGQGGFGYNAKLSAKRAETVAAALAAAGAKAELVLSGSTLAPVACDDDASKGGLNRRVEVWIQ